jgi:integrase
MTVQDKQSGSEVDQSGSETVRRVGKSHADYWSPRLTKRSYEWEGKSVEVPEWQCRISHLGRREFFNTGTPNRAAAAVRARDIYLSLLASGWDATLAKFKPQSTVATKLSLTVDEFTQRYRDAVARVEYPPSHLSVEKYVKAIGFICRRANVKKIADLSPAKVRDFIDSYLADGRKEKRDAESVKTSCNAQLRNAASLFSRQMVAEYAQCGLAITNPFDGLKLRRIDIKAYSPLKREALDKLWLDAAKLRGGDSSAPARAKRKKGQPRNRWGAPDFRQPHPEAALLLLLELGLGLRRHEADKAEWAWFSTDASGRHFLEVRETLYFKPKSRERRVIPVESVLFDAIQATRTQVSPFIVPGRLPKRYEQGEKQPKGVVYRCDLHHRVLAAWLRKQGIADNHPCHTLRKEFGSYVASSFGLFAAQRLLGHSSPEVTSRHYAGLVELPELTHAKITK